MGKLAIRDDKIDAALWTDIIYKVLSPETDQQRPTLVWLQEEFGLRKREALGVLTHPAFSKMLHNLKYAMATVEFDAVAYDRMLDIIRTGAPRTAISATQLMGKLLKRIDSSPAVVVNVERAIKALEKRQDADDIMEGEVLEEDFPDL